MSFLKLALADLRFARALSLAIVLALCALLTPLLLIAALRTGVVAELERNLISNPLVLEIKFLSNDNRLSADYIAALKADENVSFALPLTRSLSVDALVRVSGHKPAEVSVLPTAKGDPLLARAGLDALSADHEVYVSAAVAEQLELTSGSRLTLSVSRVINGERQSGREQLIVKGVLPREVLSGTQLLVTLPVLLSMEDYRDGYEPALFGDGSRPYARTAFAKLRLYAKDIYSVEPLTARLERDGYQVSSMAGQIAQFKAISSVLTKLIAVIAAVSALGGAGALWGLLSASLALKRQSFALLRLMGFTPKDILLLTLTESLIMGAAGFALSAILCLTGSEIFERLFRSALGQQTLSFLTPGEWLSFAAASLGALCLLSTLAALRQLTKAPVADILRQA